MEELQGVKDIMEAHLNLVALEFAIRPHSFQALVILRVILENDLVANHAGTASRQKLLLETFCKKCGQ